MYLFTYRIFNKVLFYLILYYSDKITIFREDYLVEAMEVVEMYCDLILARFGLVTQMKDLDEGLAEAISSIIWVAPRLQADVQELKVIQDLFTAKYGKPYADSCHSESVQTISQKLKHKLSIQSPPKLLVEKYVIEIAKSYNIPYEADPQVMSQEHGKIFTSMYPRCLQFKFIYLCNIIESKLMEFSLKDDLSRLFCRWIIN